MVEVVLLWGHRAVSRLFAYCPGFAGARPEPGPEPRSQGSSSFGLDVLCRSLSLRLPDVLCRSQGSGSFGLLDVLCRSARAASGSAWSVGRLRSLSKESWSIENLTRSWHLLGGLGFLGGAQEGARCCTFLGVI